MDYTLEKLEVYQLAEAFSDTIWELVSSWNGFQRETIGKQIVGLLIQFQQILLKGMADITIKEKASSFLLFKGLTAGNKIMAFEV